MAYIATIGGKSVRVKVEEKAAGMYRVHLGDEEILVDLFAPGGNFWSLLVDHRSHEVGIETTGGGVFSVRVDGERFAVTVVDEKRPDQAAGRGAGGSAGQTVRSPMAGNVWKILKREGEPVRAGEVLMILEAMKMENEIRSPTDGVVGSVETAEGAAVGAGTPLCIVSPPER
jgi:biotin carboxyl carrier protein